MFETNSPSYWTRLGSGRVRRRRLLSGGLAVSGLTVLGLAGCSSSNNNASNSAVPSASAAATRAAATAAQAAPSSSAATAAAGRAASPQSAGAASPAAAAAAPTAGNQKTGGTINGSFVVAGVPLDPFSNTTYTTQTLVGYVYSRLFRFNSGTDPKITLSRAPVPDLVESYQITDPTTYTLKLRQNVQFHAPLSRPVTTADVLASYKRFTTEPKNVNAQIFAPIIDSITAPDAATLQIKLKQPYAPFLNKLANPQYLWIMPAETTNGTIDPNAQMIGTGPWMWAGATATAYNYKKNPNYFIKGLPYADAATLNVIPQTATAEAQLQAGQIDLLAVPSADVDAMKKALPKATVTSYVGNLFTFFFFSDVTQDAIWKDQRLRQAASLAMDRAGLLDLIYNKQGAWDNFINPGLGKWWLDPQSAAAGDSAKWFKHDLQTAKQLMSAAGYSGQTITYIYPNDAYGDLYNQAADAARGMLADAGFKLEVRTVSYLKDYIGPTGIMNVGAPPTSVVFSLQTPFTEPDDYLSQMLVHGATRNVDHVNDPAIEALIKQQQSELDENKRLDMVYQLQRMHAEQMYYPPMVNGSTFVFTREWANNYFVADDYGSGTESLAYLSVNNK